MDELTAKVKGDAIPTPPTPPTPTPTPPPPPPPPVPREQATRDLTQSEKNPSPLRVKISVEGGVSQFIVDSRLLDAVGTKDLDFLDGILKQLARVGSQGAKIDEQSLHFMLSLVKGVKPTDQVESMLAVQMAAVHTATMSVARRLAHAENIQHQDSAERALNKLARTFTAQVEALKRYRTGGEQKVTVQHVSVSEGGQAIVGNVTQAPTRGGAGQGRRSPPALDDSQMPAMTPAGEQAPTAVPIKRKRSK
jgi:hypothetical protein